MIRIRSGGFDSGFNCFWPG